MSLKTTKKYYINNVLIISIISKGSRKKSSFYIGQSKKSLKTSIETNSSSNLSKFLLISCLEQDKSWPYYPIFFLFISPKCHVFQGFFFTFWELHFPSNHFQTFGRICKIFLLPPLTNFFFLLTGFWNNMGPWNRYLI